VVTLLQVAGVDKILPQFSTLEEAEAQSANSASA